MSTQHVADLFDRRDGDCRRRGDRQAHGATRRRRGRASSRHQHRPVRQVHFEAVRRVVVEHLADPRRDHEQRLERLDRQRLDGERRDVVLPTPTRATASSIVRPSMSPRSASFAPSPAPEVVEPADRARAALGRASLIDAIRPASPPASGWSLSASRRRAARTSSASASGPRPSAANGSSSCGSDGPRSSA